MSPPDNAAKTRGELNRAGRLSERLPVLQIMLNYENLIRTLIFCHFDLRPFDVRIER